MPHGYRQPRHRWFAAFYDFTTRFDSKDAERRRSIVPQASGRVLEIGCGTGLNFPFYDWSRVESVDASEPDPFMLSRAVDRLETLGPEAQARIRLHELPAEDLSFPDATFDTVLSTLVLCTVQDLPRAIAEIRRVLKPDGRLLLTEHVRGTGSTARIQSILQPVWGWVAAGCHLTRETEKALHDGGFELEVQERMQFSPFVPAFRGVARPQA